MPTAATRDRPFVMSRGKRFESDRRLSQIELDKPVQPKKTRLPVNAGVFLYQPYMTETELR